MLTLSPSDSVEQPVQQNLSAAKWQRVDSITIFVENNHGAETTVIHGLKIFGVPIHGTKVSDIHKQYVTCLSPRLCSVLPLTTLLSTYRRSEDH